MAYIATSEQPTAFLLKDADSALLDFVGSYVLVNGGHDKVTFTKHIRQIDAHVTTAPTVANLSNVASLAINGSGTHGVHPVFGLVPQVKGSVSDENSAKGLAKQFHDARVSEKATLSTTNMNPKLEPINIVKNNRTGRVDLYVLSGDSKDSAALEHALNDADHNAIVKAASVHGLIAVLVWIPATGSQPIKRVLISGSAPAAKIATVLEKAAKTLPFLTRPVVLAKDLMAVPKKLPPKAPTHRSTTVNAHVASARAAAPRATTVRSTPTAPRRSTAAAPAPSTASKSVTPRLPTTRPTSTNFPRAGTSTATRTTTSRPAGASGTGSSLHRPAHETAAHKKTNTGAAASPSAKRSLPAKSAVPPKTASPGKKSVPVGKAVGAAAVVAPAAVVAAAITEPTQPATSAVDSDVAAHDDSVQHLYDVVNINDTVDTPSAEVSMHEPQEHAEDGNPLSVGSHSLGADLTGPSLVVIPPTPEPPRDESPVPHVEHAHDVEPVRESSPVMDLQVSESSPVVEPQVSESSPVVEPQVRESSPVVEPQVSESSPVVEPQVSESSPVVEPQVSESSPVVEPQVKESSPVMESQGASSPILEPSQIIEPSAPTPEIPDMETTHSPNINAVESRSEVATPGSNDRSMSHVFDTPESPVQPIVSPRSDVGAEVEQTSEDPRESSEFSEAASNQALHDSTPREPVVADTAASDVPPTPEREETPEEFKQPAQPVDENGLLDSMEPPMRVRRISMDTDQLEQQLAGINLNGGSGNNAEAVDDTAASAPADLLGSGGDSDHLTADESVAEAARKLSERMVAEASTPFTAALSSTINANYAGDIDGVMRSFANELTSTVNEGVAAAAEHLSDKLTTMQQRSNVVEDDGRPIEFEKADPLLDSVLEAVADRSDEVDRSSVGDQHNHHGTNGDPAPTPQNASAHDMDERLFMPVPVRPAPKSKCAMTQPVYLDHMNVPHIGGKCSLSPDDAKDFFAGVRSSSYLLASEDLALGVLQGWLEGRKLWFNDEAKTSIVPTVNHPNLRAFTTQNQDELERLHMEVHSSVENNTITLNTDEGPEHFNIVKMTL